MQAPWLSQAPPPSRGAARTEVSVAPGSHRQDVRGHSSHVRTRGDDRGCSGPPARRGARHVHHCAERTVACSGPSSRRPRPTSLVMKFFGVGRLVARRTARRRRKEWRAPTSYAALRRKPADTSPPGKGGRARESRRGLETRLERVKRCFLACREARPVRRRRSTWLSRVGRSKGHDRPTRTGRRSGAGEGQRARRTVRARASVSRLQSPDFVAPCLPQGASHRGGLARGGQPERVARHARGASPSEEGREPDEGVSDRGKPSLSREAVEAVSIPRTSRVPTCEGGGGTRGVTRRQRRSRAWSETASWDRVPEMARRTHARANTPPRRRTARRSGSSAS